MRIIFACVVLALLQSTFAIFQEQLGEYDWKHSNIGLIEKSIYSQGKLFVFTNDYVLARINPESGKVKWSVTLPKHTQIEKFLVLGDFVFTLSRQVNGVETRSDLVSSWSILNGHLNWDVFVGTSEQSTLYPSDLIYNPHTKQFVALSGNSIHFVDYATNIPQLTSWSPNDDAEDNNSAYFLSGLTIPSKDNYYVASGCVVNKGSQEKASTCKQPSIISYNPTTKAHSIETASNTLNVSPSEVKSTISVSNQNTIEDILFGIRDDDNDNKVLKVFSFSEQQEYSLSLPHVDTNTATGSGHKIIKNIESFLYNKQGEDFLLPAVKYCTSTTNDDDDHCYAYYASRDTDNNNNNNWGWKEIVQCSSGGGVIQLESLASYENIITDVHCALFTPFPLSSSSSTDSYLDGVTIVSTEKTVNNVELINAVKVSPFHLAHIFHSTQENIHHMAITREVSTKSSTTTSAAAKNSNNRGTSYYQLLVVFNSGYTAMFSLHATTTDTGIAELLWSKDESLSRIHQALVVDVVKTASTSNADTKDVTIPTFAERLQLQKDELAEYALQLLQSSELIQSQSKILYESLLKLSKNAANALGGVNSNNKKRGNNNKESVQRTPRNINKMKLFGFDKVAICLSYADELEDQITSNGEGRVTWSQAHIKITALDLLRDIGKEDESATNILWSTFPTFDDENNDASHQVITYIHLAKNTISTTSTHNSPVKSVSLIVGTSNGNTYVWDIDAKTGKSAIIKQENQKPWVVASSGNSNNNIKEHNKRYHAVTVSRLIKGNQAVNVIGSHLDHVNSRNYAIVTAANDKQLAVSFLPTPSTKDKKIDKATVDDKSYFHNINKKSGELLIYKMTNNTCTGSTGGGAVCVQSEVVASVVFSPTVETIVDITYPNPDDLATIHSRSSILGDDSVLLKYLNPNVVLISTISPPSAAIDDYYNPFSAASSTNNATTGDSATTTTTAEVAVSTLTMSLVDTVTGKIIKRIVHESGTKPVHAVIIENNIVATYWNCKAKRTELSSTALYEGVIGRYDMGPLASSTTNSGSSARTNYYNTANSAYTAILPMAMQKSYVLPRGVAGLYHTVTSQGITNKNVLIVFTNGQLYSTDMRQIHPRRPFGDPTQSEKEEGLSKYNAFLMLNPISSLTYDYTIRGVNNVKDNRIHIATASSKLESSTIVFTYGPGIDLHLNRALPSQGFDLLASDFQYGLLVMILMGLGLAVLWLRNLHQNKNLKSFWK